MSSNRSRAGGLPSGPRSRSSGRSRPDEPTSYDRDHRSSPLPTSRQVRPQKPMNSIQHTRSRSRPPPMPEPRQSPRQTHNSSRSSDSRTSSAYRRDSETSSGSSFIERMRVGNGYASSRTSLEEEDQQSTSKRPPDYRGRSLRTMKSPQEQDDSRDQYASDSTGTGDGYTIWSRVAAAAGNLTVNVSKAWAANIATFTGEETPPGEESRLTRAMKAYHVSKARYPSDLPAWLFDESERQPKATRSQISTRQADDGYEAVDRSEPAKPRGLRDIYDAAAASSSSTSATPIRSARPSARYDDPVQPSKATDRLKALRDAKRSALKPSAPPSREGNERYGLDRNDVVDRPVGDSGEWRARRVGLPSGPGVRPQRI